jgi:hypothetical protein
MTYFQFISTEDMNKFTELGYTFTSKYTPNKLGNTYHVIVTDKDGNEVVHTQCSYGNGSGHGYAMSGAETQAVAELKAIIEGRVSTKEEYDTDFLSRLLEWGYITEYGYSKQGELLIMFDSWNQVEGRRKWDDEKHNWVQIDKSVYAKLVDLADKNLLKPSVNKTIKEVEFVFSDEYMRCDSCGCICHTTWDGIHYVEGTGEVLCDDCINESDEAIESLIEEAKDDFSKALPVMISEDKIKELGYEAVDDTDFSTRSSQWGEDSWSCHNLDTDTCKRLCCDYDGFAKLTGVYQFEAEFQLYFPSNTVEQAKEELKTIL